MYTLIQNSNGTGIQISYPSLKWKGQTPYFSLSSIWITFTIGKRENRRAPTTIIIYTFNNLSYYIFCSFTSFLILFKINTNYNITPRYIAQIIYILKVIHFIQLIIYLKLKYVVLIIQCQSVFFHEYIFIFIFGYYFLTKYIL